MYALYRHVKFCLYGFYSQAYCNIIAGACMALGLRYAGTANKNAFKTLYNYTQMFLELSHKTVAELAGKSTVETCMNVVLLSAAVVMAGTGNLDVSVFVYLTIIHKK